MYNPICDNYVSKCNHDLVYIHTRQAETMSGCCGNRTCNLRNPTKPKTPQICFKLSILQQVATNLSISSSCNKSVKIRLVVTCHLQTCYNLLKQLAATLWMTSFDNQLVTSLLTTCNRLVVNKLSQAIRMHPDIGLL